MAFLRPSNRPYGLGDLIALLVLIACFVCWLAVAHVTLPMIVVLIGALALAYLIG